MNRPLVKLCSKCAKEKSADEFYPSKAAPDGLQSWCKNCQKVRASHPDCVRARREARKTPEKRERDRITRRIRDSRPEVKQRLRFNEIKRKYGLSRETYLGMVQEVRLSGCPICKCTFEDSRFHIDHDHACCSGGTSCGKCVRGFICHKCNIILGLANDSTQTLAALMCYLRGEL